MQPDTEKLQWRMIGKTVPGASHLRAGLENQDAISSLPSYRVGPPLIVTLSDGHGSARCFRSQIGAQLAVEFAPAVIEAFLEHSGDSELSALRRDAKEELPKRLVRTWQRWVRSHLVHHPISAQDDETLQRRSGATAAQALRENPLLAYGATLLAAAITESFILYLQLGDGEILTVSDLGEVTRPLPRDDELMGNETTSLCLRKAEWLFRVHLQPLADRPPALILLCTDGIPNSFAEEAGFRQVGSDLLREARTEGLQQIERQLETWLRQMSERASGDDMTVGIICRSDAIAAPTGKEQPGPGGSRELQAEQRSVDAPAAEALCVPPAVEAPGGCAQARASGGTEPPKGKNGHDSRRAENTTGEGAAAVGTAP